MGTTEYFEYCEDEVKIKIKSELSRNRKSAEYFDEDVKEDPGSSRCPQAP